MLSKPPLKPNPFTAYRDPATGRWIVVQADSDSLSSSSSLTIVGASIEQMQPCFA